MRGPGFGAALLRGCGLLLQLQKVGENHPGRAAEVRCGVLTGPHAPEAPGRHF